MEINKEELLQTCLNIVETKENELKDLILATRTSANNDTKSSMGDKYETSREMLQQEINMLEKQLDEIRKQLLVLRKIKFVESDKVILGSLVRTAMGLFFLSIGTGIIKWNNLEVMTISLSSPLANQMLHKKIGEHFTINNKSYTIEELS
jgi:hypothetical protein